MHLHPRKRFGQHFLQDSNVIEKIVQFINPDIKDHVIEIGPGKGALTKQLLTRLNFLEAVEIDRNLIPVLEEEFSASGKLKIYQTDALQFDFAFLKKSGPALRIVGNLPYNISTPLLFHLIEQKHAILDMHFMLQKEVVERLQAAVDTSDYGRLSVMVQYHCEVTQLLIVNPEAFSPPPQVYSAIVRLVPYATPPYPADHYADFQKVVRLAFNQRRKTLKNCLKSIISSDELIKLGINPIKRPEAITLEEYVRIANFVSSASLPPLPVLPPQGGKGRNRGWG